MKRPFIVFLLGLAGILMHAQENDAGNDTLRKDALNVFMEAGDHMRREIPYINYVRDIKDAGVYIISTREVTGSGGREYTYFLVGQHGFEGMRDTLSFTCPPDETTDGRRKKEIATLKMGLMRYVARTPLSKYIDIQFTEPLSETVSVDKWNSWVIEPSVSAYLSGQKSFKRSYLSGEISADRITEEWKIRIGMDYFYSTEKFEIDDEIITSNSTSSWANVLLVKSLNDHWSYGGSMSLQSSTYNNVDIMFKAAAALEYDLFPYSESTRRQLRILYRAGYSFVDYTDTTIYNRTEEHLWLHTLTVAYEVVQKWGNIDVNMGYSNYFHDWSKNFLDFGGSISLRIAKGLSLRLYSHYSIIHNQLGLVKGGVSAEEVLLQIKELETQYRYYVSFGFSYTFGSIYNNVVNPRFGHRRSL